jgi:hypothetical protein
MYKGLNFYVEYYLSIVGTIWILLHSKLMKPKFLILYFWTDMLDNIQMN